MFHEMTTTSHCVIMIIKNYKVQSLKMFVMHLTCNPYEFFFFFFHSFCIFFSLFHYYCLSSPPPFPPSFFGGRGDAIKWNGKRSDSPNHYLWMHFHSNPNRVLQYFKLYPFLDGWLKEVVTWLCQMFPCGFKTLDRVKKYWLMVEMEFKVSGDKL